MSCAASALTSYNSPELLQQQNPPSQHTHTPKAGYKGAEHSNTTPSTTKQPESSTVSMPPPAEPPALAPPRRPETTRHRRPGQPSRPPHLNPKIDRGVPLRRAPVPAAGGSSLTPASPPTPENRLTQKSIQSTEVWLNQSRAAARARGRAASAVGRASDRARAGAARSSEQEPEQQQLGERAIEREREQ